MQNNYMPNPSTFQVYNASAGSGKTYTLVKEYLKILLQTSDANRFKNILAVTFTNKAAAEMKDRILQNLRAFAKPSILQNKTELFLHFENEFLIKDSELHKRAGNVLHNILQNYSAFNITTIDSFTYRLIKNFAFDLGLSLNFDVEMDVKSLLTEAVEALVSKLGEDAALTKILIDFSLQKANDDKSWDITRELNEIAQILLNENDNEHVQAIQEKPIQDFIDLKKNIQKKQAIIEGIFAEIGKKGLLLIDNLNIEYKDFYYSQFPNHFLNLINNPTKLNFDPSKGLAKSIENNLFYTKGKPESVKGAIDSITTALLELYNASKKDYQKYTLHKLFLSSLIPLAVLSRINTTLDELKEEKNIRLNAEFNQLISKNIQKQPAPYIYERIGEKLQYYFIDEMQDTSVLQWQNMIPLIANALSQENTSLLLVGDTKQAIYRWRGSEPEQFLQLAREGESDANNPFFIPKQTQLLDTNYRSYTEIINFNNRFFQHISTFFTKPEYAEMYARENQQKTTAKEGGYVQLSFIDQGLTGDDKLLAYIEKVLETILKVSENFALNEICVLVRKKKEGVAIAKYLTENKIPIISSETLLIQNSHKVRFIINLLHYLQNNDNQEAKLEVLYFLYDDLKIEEEKHHFLIDKLELPLNNLFESFREENIDFDSSYFKVLSLYESVEYIIRTFSFNKTSDAYIQFFLDEVLQFSQQKSNTSTAFLEFWETKKENLSIVVPDEKDAVRIMTIHKSKGLEFPVVIYPFDLNIYGEHNPKTWYSIKNKEAYNNFESLLITNPKSLRTLEETGTVGKQLFQQHKNGLELDNFNLIYVTLTRAVEQLYIIVETKKADNGLKTSSQFFINFLQLMGMYNEHQNDYSFGTSNRVSKKPLQAKKMHEFTKMISTSWQSHHINIVRNSNLLYDEEVQESINYGNLMHEILAEINTEDDIEGSIQTYNTTGKITNSQAVEIQKTLFSVVQHPELKEYFQHNLTAYNEREILTEQGEIIIPDRLVINAKNEAIIIDYKTGKSDKQYHYQLNNYAAIIEQLNYKVSKKLLVYLGENIVVEQV